HFKEGLTVDEGINLAIRGLTAAMKRDSASGNGIAVASITNKEFKELDDKDVQKRIEKMKLA
ncbi:MAG: proteasome subunit beta, partial [Thermoplasmata archaeon]|nr:proteasome subunit beta [Thermoplasmata archaeon]